MKDLAICNNSLIQEEVPVQWQGLLLHSIRGQLLLAKETFREHACHDIEAVFCLFDFVEKAGQEKAKRIAVSLSSPAV